MGVCGCGVCVHHTLTDIYTAALLPKKPSSGDDSGFRHGFGAEALLLLNPSAPAVTHDTIRLWLFKSVIFLFAYKRYMHIQEFLLENEAHVIFFNLETETDHLVLARRPTLVLI